jgi:hypothetical protein
VKIQDTKTQAAVEVAEVVVNAEGKVVTEDDQLVEELLNNINATFALDKPKPKHAKDLFEVYGYSFKASEASALQSEYSIPPVAVTNKSEFFRWLQSYFAEYLLETRSIDEIVGQSFDDPDEAADAVFEALANDDALKKRVPGVPLAALGLQLRGGVNGFYDNGGGKCLRLPHGRAGSRLLHP